jgi:hypothetical protein
MGNYWVNQIAYEPMLFLGQDNITNVSYFAVIGEDELTVAGPVSKESFYAGVKDK